MCTLRPGFIGSGSESGSGSGSEKGKEKENENENEEWSRIDDMNSFAPIVVLCALCVQALLGAGARAGAEVRGRRGKKRCLCVLCGSLCSLRPGFRGASLE